MKKIITLCLGLCLSIFTVSIFANNFLVESLFPTGHVATGCPLAPPSPPSNPFCYCYVADVVAGDAHCSAKPEPLAIECALNDINTQGPYKGYPAGIDSACEKGCQLDPVCVQTCETDTTALEQIIGTDGSGYSPSTCPAPSI